METTDHKLASKSASAAGRKQPEAATARTLWTGFEVPGLAEEVSSGDREKQSPSVPICGVVLRDRTSVEMVRNPSSGAVALLRREPGGKTTITREVACDGYRYVATAAASQIPHLPAEPMPYGSTTALFSAVAEFITKYSDLGDDEVALLASFSLSSFFGECLTLASSLLLFGAPLPAVALMRVLACVCRHPVLCLGSSVTGLAPELRPTRLICQSDAGTERQLAGFQFSGFTTQSAHPRQISGASVIYAADGELKTPFANLCLQLLVPRGNCSFGPPEQEREAATITSLQNQLLMYRLENYVKVKDSEFDVPEFYGPSREYARTLGRCIVDAPEVQARLRTLLQARSDAERTEDARTLDAVIVDALVVCCHERRPWVHVGEIAKLTNAILKSEDETVELTPKQVGGRLKAMQFRTTRLDSGGRGMYLLNGECARIHKLGRALGSVSVDKGLLGCRYCKNE
ncbi:MAG TPA: hypothetical protein VMH03_11650 [Terriglobales bacterium]|nr:hypothetical protein [Terriglobales bacterium]